MSPPKQRLPLWSSPEHPPSTTPMLWLWLWPLLWSQILPPIHQLLSYMAALLLSDPGLENTRIHAQSDSAMSHPSGHPKPRVVQPDTFHLGKILQSQALLQRTLGQPFFFSFLGKKKVLKPISTHFPQREQVSAAGNSWNAHTVLGFLQRAGRWFKVNLIFYEIQTLILQIQQSR